MIKEYIEKHLHENKKELEKQNDQLQKLMKEQENAKLYLENLQKQKNVQINIFSPRNIDDTLEEKIEKGRENVQIIENEIEQARKSIEELEEKKKEYEALEKEAKKPSAQKNDLANIIKNAIEKNLSEREGNEKTSEKESIYKEGIEKEYIQKESEETRGEVKGKESKKESEGENQKETEGIKEIGKENKKEAETEGVKETEKENALEGKGIAQEDVKKELIDKINIFMNSIYRKNEMCLAFLNSDKNKCKSELLSMKKEIKRFVSEIENIMK